MPPEISDVSVESTGSGAKTQHKVNAVSTKSTRTGAQAKSQKIIVAPIKRKKMWTKETAESTDPSLKFERSEEEGGVEGPIPSTQADTDEELAEMDEGEAAREEQAAVIEKGATTIEEGAAAREEEEATRELGAHPKTIMASKCHWIRSVAENLEDSSNPLHRPTYDRERMERDYEYSIYEDDPRDRDGRSYRDYRERSMELSWRQSRNQLWTYIHIKAENMRKWDGKPTSKLETRVRELKQNDTDKKIVYVVDTEFLEKKLQSPKHKKMEVCFDNDKKASKNAKSDHKCSDQDQ
ncbi:hypothetical protein BTVI_149713 [Pitangus sulphuratus]|nr:hypothetical protein BTVI_149713 [Pitangus sulphuratus]